MLLPFWSSEIHVELPSWFPWGRDYQPVSINRLYDSALNSIAESCFDMESEFFFLSSPFVGCVGSLAREKYFQTSPDKMFNLGFLMVFAYSEQMEKTLIASFAAAEVIEDLNLGIAFCSIWRDGVFEKKIKTIVIVSNEPFYDCTGYILKLPIILDGAKKFLKSSPLSYFAEKFGFNRFHVNWENMNPYQIATARILSELESGNAKNIVGGSSMINFPPFFGLSIAEAEK